MLFIFLNQSFLKIKNNKQVIMGYLIYSINENSNENNAYLKKSNFLRGQKLKNHIKIKY